jgi:hypothetical protein
MKAPQSLVERLTKVITETMGRDTGELFHKFYELEDDDEVMAGAQSLLEDFMGPDMARKKLKQVDHK